MADVVQAAFVDGLKARGVATGGNAAAGFRLTGRVLQLDANQVFRRFANAEVELSVIESPGEAVRMTRRYSASRQDGEVMSMNAGAFASVEDLRVVMELTLRELVDKALDDPELRAAMAL